MHLFFFTFSFPEQTDRHSFTYMQAATKEVFVHSYGGLILSFLVFISALFFEIRVCNAHLVADR